MSLRIYLLGRPRITLNENHVNLPGHRPLALLAYLLLTNKAHRREHLIDLFFDYPDDPQAALRWTLSKLRKSIGSEYILADRVEVSFNFQSDYWLDVDAFKAGETELYQGDFLEGHHLRDALRYEEWLLSERQSLRDAYQSGLEQQLEIYKSQGEHAAVIITSQRLLKLDELREDWHFALIHAYARLGKRATALEQFELCRRLLLKEWGEEPSKETLALVDAIRSGQIGAEPPLNQSEADLGVLSGPANQAPEPPSLKVTGTPQIHQRAALPRKAFAGIATIVLVGLLVFGLSQGFNFNRQSIAEGGGSPSTEGSSGQTGSISPEFEGTSVLIVGSFRDEEAKLFQQSMIPFEEKSGIDVLYVTGDPLYDLDIEIRLETGENPDIIIIPQPGWLEKLADQGKIIDIGTFLDDEYLFQQYPEIFTELVKVDGRFLGIIHTVNLKSLVWYPKRAFEAMGYQVPKTWDELIALSDQIVADGGVPWCIGIESLDATGWPATDWIEDILLRTAPPEIYDAWVQHDLLFNSPQIRRAFEIMGQIWLNDGYVYGGTANIVVENFSDSPDHLFEDPPGCYLHKLASFAPFFFPPGLVYGQDYDFFQLPPIDPQFGNPALGAGNIFVMVTDRPEVRETMRYLTTAESTRAFIENGGYLNPHRSTPIEWFPSPADLRYAQIILGADAYRFDASDLMPEEVGLGSFFRGIIDWLGGADLETVLQEIDDSWPED